MKTKKIDPKLPNNHKVQRQATATYPKIKAGQQKYEDSQFSFNSWKRPPVQQKTP